MTGDWPSVDYGGGMAYERMRSFNKHVINSLTRTFAGSAHSPFALIRHFGRRSAKAYETPIIAEPLGNGFVIALTYGSGVDWYRNVLAAGQCALLWHGNVYTLNKPEPMDPEKALLAFPPLLRLLLRARNTKDFVTVKP